MLMVAFLKRCSPLSGRIIYMTAVSIYFTNKILPYDMGLRVHQKRVVQALADIFYSDPTFRCFHPSDNIAIFWPDYSALCPETPGRVCWTDVKVQHETPGPVCWTGCQGPTRDTGPCELDRRQGPTRDTGPCVLDRRQGPTRDTGHCVFDRMSRHRALCVGEDVKVHLLTISSQHKPHDCQGTVSMIHEIWATQCQFTEHVSVLHVPLV